MAGTLAAYGTLFFTAFGAASLLPFYSEPLLVGMVRWGGYDPVLLWLTASAGNTAGAVLNWWLARYALHWQDRWWFPFRPQHLARASGWFQRYGVWTLLLAWAPVGGDALTFVAGLMRVRLGIFLLLVGAGKAGRYALVIWATPVAGT
ncbi:MAG: DedA family protein [Pseudomonadota bacterium]|nr:DedA family protein [Pseudomonadota bacterium]